MTRRTPFKFAVLRLAVLVFGLAYLPGVTDAPAADSAKTMLVLDASGSMWGKVEGAAKIDIARRTIRGLMKDWDKDVELGLTVYGHRSKGDCNDIQVLFPVGPAQSVAIASAVDKLSPKGKTPLTEAVRRAAQHMKFTESKATVILVSDGVETCEADPCKAAAELKKLGIDFTVHVVGFDLKKSEQAELKCLADNTGGLFLSAANASQLTAALKTAVVKVKEQAKVVVAPPPEPVASGKAGHLFTALLLEGGEPVTRDMRWDVYEAATTLDGKRKLIKGTYDAQPLIALPPGKYVMAAKYGEAVVTQPFAVESAQESAKHVVVLNAGLVAAKATYADGGETVSSGMSWQIFDLEKGLDGKQRRITGTYDTQPNFRLPAGRYQLLAKRDAAEVAQTIEVSAGKRSDFTVNLNAGLLAPAVALAAGAPRIEKGVRWTVYGIEKDLSGKRTRYRGTYDAKPVFTLSAGKYLLEADNGNARVEMEVEVAAAKRAEPVLNLNAGQIKLVAVKGGTPVNATIRWDIFGSEKNLEGKRTHIAGANNASPIFTLPAGKFHVRMKMGATEQEAELEVKAGDSKQVEVRLQ